MGQTLSNEKEKDPTAFFGFQWKHRGKTMAKKSTATIVKRANQLYEQGKHKESFELYAQAAEQGDTFSLCKVGQMYAEGDGVEKDPVKAFEFFKRSSVDGNRDATFELGRCYFDGLGTEMDQDRGYELVLSSANEGFAPAQNYIGAIYANGEKVEKNDDIAFEWLKKSADQGFPKALFNVSRFYHMDKYKDDAKCIECLYKAAEGKYPDALYFVAMRIIRGADKERSIHDAIEQLNLAASKGFALADNQLGMMYFRGDHVEKDYVEAEKHLLAAAEKGNTDAMYTLGRIYHSDTDMHDSRKAFKWFERAATDGDARAMGWAGEAYYFGRGVNSDYRRAFKLFKKSAKAGVKYSMYWVGKLYREGNGVNKNVDKARKWLDRAIDAGFHQADYEMGLMYLERDIEEKRYVEKAIEHFRRAAEDGYYPAMYELAFYYENCKFEKSTKEAIYWYKKSAEGKYIPAMMDLADHYESGSFIPTNYDKAYALYNEVYERTKDPRAAASIGHMNEFGLGRDVDIAEAKKWYHIGAKDGSDYSMFRLGFIAWKADENDESIYWLRRAAANGHKEAMYGLAEHYETGDVVPQSLSRALEWYHRASDAGNKDAKSNFEVLIDHLDDEDEESFPDELKRLAGEEEDTEAMIQLADLAEDEKTKRMWLGFAAELDDRRAIAMLEEMGGETE